MRLGFYQQMKLKVLISCAIAYELLKCAMCVHLAQVKSKIQGPLVSKPIEPEPRTTHDHSEREQ